MTNLARRARVSEVSIPSRGFWFFEAHQCARCRRCRYSAVSIPSRGFWFFEDIANAPRCVWMPIQFQSPRGDFGFLKVVRKQLKTMGEWIVSIPSRGFWFFEERCLPPRGDSEEVEFQSPRGDFGFLKRKQY